LLCILTWWDNIVLVPSEGIKPTLRPYSFEHLANFRDIQKQGPSISMSFINNNKNTNYGACYYTRDSRLFNIPLHAKFYQKCGLTFAHYLCYLILYTILCSWFHIPNKLFHMDTLSSKERGYIAKNIKMFRNKLTWI
jgi:hypothetical protein